MPRLLIEIGGFARMMLAPRIRALETRHQDLESRIAAEGLRPRPDETALARLKREKLQLKEEMERLRKSH
jgi:hypothetical protein